MSLTAFLDGPKTAGEAGLSQNQRTRALAAGLLQEVTKEGRPVVRHTQRRGRPAKVLKLTPRGRSQAKKAAA
jgi:predicted ArsR family transcriptional regulator